MIRECVVLNGAVINTGPWEHHTQQVEVKLAVIDDEGKELEPAVYEMVDSNPLPEGAEIVEMEVYQDALGQWRPVGHEPGKSPEQERIEQLETQYLTALEAIADLYEMLLGG